MSLVPGQLRLHWDQFMRSLDGLGSEELSRRWDLARRIIRENGVTYNVYGDPRGMDRPWELDSIPLLLPASEWETIEAGLIQRARLLNFIVSDLYGPRRLLMEAGLPPAVVFANPAYLRPCHGVEVPRGIHLHHIAFDLARSPDGQWWVLADRTQAPSGTGYALENRIVLSRTLPDLFSECRVQRLASFFRQFRETLWSLSPAQRETARIVILTPGPFNETYFEHAFLARYLGFTLIQGGDLTVREDRVFLKTLEGLQPVDVILRRLDDSFCDPLELRADSFLGIAGLIEAIKAGNVTIANALGSGLVETPAIMPFLPGLCTQILGEALTLPSAATWWCGQPGALQYVLDHLDELVIKPAFPAMGLEPVFGRELKQQRREELTASLRRFPYDYVGQEQVALSTAPVWIHGKLQPRSVVLRAYVVASGDSYTVMPGGLTRVSSSAETSVVSMQRGGGSKDTWILASGPVDTFSLLTPADQPVELTRAANDLPSRVADNIFWLGRYAERAEDTARLLRSILTRLTGEERASGTLELSSLWEVFRCLRGVIPLPAELGQENLAGHLEKELIQMIYESGRQGSLRDTLQRLGRISAIVRDRLSSDTVRILSQLQVRGHPSRHRSLGDVLSVLNRRIITLAAFRGIEMENITRGPGWRFLNIGRRLERVTHIIQLFRGILIGYRPGGLLLLEILLEVADSSMTYRSRYFTTLQPEPVLDLLMKDETNPRSLAFQLVDLNEHLQHLPRLSIEAGMNQQQARIAGLLTKLRQADALSLCAPDLHHFRPRLAALLDEIAAAVPALSDTITHHYFSHAHTTRQLALIHTEQTP